MRENFRDDAFWGILAKKKKNLCKLQVPDCRADYFLHFRHFFCSSRYQNFNWKATVCNSVYYKPTDSYSYLLYSSSHPSLAKDYISFSQFLRLRLCSDDSDFPEKSEAMSQFFDIRGYPVSVVQVGYHRAQQIDQQSALQTAKKENTYRNLFTLTFHPRNHAVKSIILKNFQLLHNDSETGTAFSQPPQISFKREKNIGNLFFWSKVHFKPMTNLELSNALAHDAKLVLSFIT